MAIARNKSDSPHKACFCAWVALCVVVCAEKQHASRRLSLYKLAASASETMELKKQRAEQNLDQSSMELYEKQQAGSATQMLHAIAPRLKDDSEIKQLIESRVTHALEERMKFFPGLASIKTLLHWNSRVAGPRMGPVKEPINVRNERRILSVHDFASGYNEMSDNDYLMLFRSWELVDIFAYFSHVQIAVPPLQWTMAAHLRNRPALGTIMLEGASGQVADIAKNREEVLEKLVNLTDHYGFDGWFFNMETFEEWPKGDPQQFLGELRSKLKKRVGDHAMVIAYPYMPNHAIFKKVDGVFVNYNWDESDKSLAKLVKSSAGRPHDVYMGMDAFGGRRGNNEPDPHHVGLCAKNNLSIAVFAPGYTLFIKANGKYSKDAVDYDRRYWGSIGENFGREIPESLRSGRKWPLDWKVGALEHRGELPSRTQISGVTHSKVGLQIDGDGLLPSAVGNIRSKKLNHQ